MYAVVVGGGGGGGRGGLEIINQQMSFHEN